jgi:hypothetical protein
MNRVESAGLDKEPGDEPMTFDMLRQLARVLPPMLSNEPIFAENPEKFVISHKDPQRVTVVDPKAPDLLRDVTFVIGSPHKPGGWGTRAAVETRQVPTHLAYKRPHSLAGRGEPITGNEARALTEFFLEDARETGRPVYPG